MKIATYNVWNEDKGIGKRFKQLIHEINTVDTDIIGLQEVTPFFYYNILIKETFNIENLYYLKMISFASRKKNCKS